MKLYTKCPTDIYSKAVLYVSALNKKNNLDTQRFKVGATLKALLDTLVM